MNVERARTLRRLLETAHSYLLPNYQIRISVDENGEVIYGCISAHLENYQWIIKTWENEFDVTICAAIDELSAARIMSELMMTYKAEDYWDNVQIKKEPTSIDVFDEFTS